jgi:mono/diheme cytochrome c family protein
VTGKIIRYMALVVLVFSLGMGCGNNNDVDPSNGPPVDADEPSADELISMGGPLYDRNCARCHGADGAGQGGAYPALAGSDMVTGDPEPVIEIVVHGRGAMPAFGQEFDNEQLAAVVSYVRNAWGNDASAVSPSDVEDVR